MDFLIAFFGIKTNVPIVEFITNNVILIGMIMTVLAVIVALTPWGWDNRIFAGIKRAIGIVKPDFKVPEETKEPEDAN